MSDCGCNLQNSVRISLTSPYPNRPVQAAVSPSPKRTIGSGQIRRASVKSVGATALAATLCARIADYPHLLMRHGRRATKKDGAPLLHVRAIEVAKVQALKRRVIAISHSVLEAIAYMHHPDRDMICAKCGTILNAPEWLEILSEGRVFNLWSCTKCGFCFAEVSTTEQAKATESSALTTAA